MTAIHPQADVHPDARLAEGVTVDAGACVEQGCVIGRGSSIGRHSVIWRGTVLGRGNRIFPFCSLGGEPQDKKYAGEDAPLVVGDDNVIREYCFINKGTAASGETRIGSRNLLMAYTHVAHDCVLGDDIIVANGAQMAGHVVVGDGAVIGGGVLFHQFRRVGVGALIGGGEAMRQDAPPYALCAEGVVSVNSEGMRRRGLSAADVAAVRRAYKLLYRAGLSQSAAAERIARMKGADAPPLLHLVEFLRTPGLRLLRPRRRA